MKFCVRLTIFMAACMSNFFLAFAAGAGAHPALANDCAAGLEAYMEACRMACPSAQECLDAQALIAAAEHAMTSLVTEYMQNTGRQKLEEMIMGDVSFSRRAGVLLVHCLNQMLAMPGWMVLQEYFARMREPFLDEGLIVALEQKTLDAVQADVALNAVLRVVPSAEQMSGWFEIGRLLYKQMFHVADVFNDVRDVVLART